VYHRFIFLPEIAAMVRCVAALDAYPSVLWIARAALGTGIR
jgi:hypothetical protein